MKVLEKGQFRYTFECEECRAILMAVESDFKDRDGSVTTASGLTGGVKELTCECPECSTVHVADQTKIPADVRTRIINRWKPPPGPVFRPRMEDGC